MLVKKDLIDVASWLACVLGGSFVGYLLVHLVIAL